MSDARFISLWAGNVGSDMPAHLRILYASLGENVGDLALKQLAAAQGKSFDDLLQDNR
jgi:hypothetical protein